VQQTSGVHRVGIDVPNIIIRRLVFFLFTVLATANGFADEEPVDVIYPNINGLGDTSYGYAVLKLALDASHKPYRLSLNTKSANNNRIRKMLSEGQITVADFGTSMSFENDFNAVLVPLDYGISGWRLLAMHKANLHLSAKINTVTDLEVLTLGQGTGWSDVDILNNAGLSVLTAPKLSHLFRMLEAKRFEAIPLGANEIYSLLDSYQDQAASVAIEPSLLIVYPFARLFFVNKENVRLHGILQAGLENAFADGSLWKLFRNHPQNTALFDKAGLQDRRIIKIDYDILKKHLDKIPQEYFLSIDDLKPPE
jgi:hypothetical protein